MPTTITERQKGRSKGSGSNPFKQRVYTVTGTEDEDVAQADLEAFAPETIGTYTIDDIAVDELADGVWEGVVRWTPPSVQIDPEPETNDRIFTFTTSGGSQRITQSLQTIASYAPPGKSAPDFKGAINVTQDGVEGVDVGEPVKEFEVTLFRPDASVNDAYQDALYEQAWTVNNDNITINNVTYPAGSLLFKGLTRGTKRDSADDWELVFSFAASKNKTNITIGDITVAAKKGWEYLWVFYEEAVSNGVITKVPRAVYIEEVFEESDLETLGVHDGA